MAYVFDTVGDIIDYLCTISNIKDEAQRETEFKEYFAEYEKAVRCHNNLSGISDEEVHSKLVNNLVYLAGNCDDSVCECIEALAGKSLLAVHAEQKQLYNM